MHTKARKRLSVILLNTGYQLLGPVLNAITSAFIIRQTSPDLWGAFIALLIPAQLLAHISSWGSKEYLLREFSLHPEQINPLWQKNLMSRLALFAAGAILLFISAGSLTSALVVLILLSSWYIARSLDVIILYRRDFLLAILAEIMSTGLFLVIFLSSQPGDVMALLAFYALTQLGKSLFLMAYYRGLLAHFQIIFEAQQLRLAFPFFLMGFSGLLASRIDLYTVSILMDKKAVGEYQVFINLMLYLQAISAFVVAPFAKTIYRLSDAAIFKLALRLFGVGIVLTWIGTMGIFFVLYFIYALDYAASFFIAGGLFVLPIYGYLLLIHRLYRMKKEQHVLVVNLMGAVANFFLNLMLLPSIGLIGAIVASALIQWAMLGYYVLEVGFESRRAVA